MDSLRFYEIELLESYDLLRLKKSEIPFYEKNYHGVDANFQSFLSGEDLREGVFVIKIKNYDWALWLLKNDHFRIVG